MRKRKIISNNKNGVTLLGLVVMIIIIIILAGITISWMIGDKGIFRNAELARQEHKKGQIIEYLNLKLLDKQAGHYNETNEYIIEQTREDVNKNQNDLKQIGRDVEVKEVRKNGEKVYFYVIVDKGIYEVSLGGTKYIGQQTEEDIELQKGDITFFYTPSDWTNKSVKVEIKASIDMETYDIEYKTEKENQWKLYNGEIEVDQNQDIYARLVGINGQTSVATGTVANIDKLTPNTFTPTVTTTSSSITITASTTDQASTSDNGSSGIEGYSFSNDNGTNWTEYQTNGEYTFNNLTPDTTYMIQVRAKDKAGNVTTATATAKTSYPTVVAKLKVGDYVKYQPTSQSYTITTSESGHTSNQTFNTSDYTGLWRVLYNDSTNGLQLISAEPVIQLTINGKVGYNQFVTTLNTVGSKYVNTTYSTSGRSVGSDPISPASTISIYRNSQFDYIETLANDMLVADTNYEKDDMAMSNANMNNIGTDYWMASRYILANTNGAGFHGVLTDSTGEIISLAFMCVHSYGETSGHSYTKGVRPVVTIDQNIFVTTGQGTENSPYNISK